jgi:hypothetical protein
MRFNRLATTLRHHGLNQEGWVPVNTHEGTFYVKDSMLVTTGKPTGFMRTEKQYQNFILELDWKHTNTREVGNSGLFLWADPLPALGTIVAIGQAVAAHRHDADAIDALVLAHTQTLATTEKVAVRG